MIAAILLGGLGTRLRPFTLSTPKPLLPVLNKPFLDYQIAALERAGITDIVLCASYQSEAFERVAKRLSVRRLKIRVARERVPLGTGGAVKNAEALLRNHGTLLVLNGDVLNAVDFKLFAAFHDRRSARASLALTRVKDPTAYGLVMTEDSGRIKKFLEKPSWDEVEVNTVNAGAYLFEPEVLDLIPPDAPYSLERSLFPELLQNGRRFFGYVSSGYWIDIGTVESYRRVHMDLLRGFAPSIFSRRGAGPLIKEGPAAVGRELSFQGPADRILLGRGCRVSDFARFAGTVSLGAGCRVGKGAALENCVVLDGTRIGDGARIENCVVGPDCEIGLHSVLSGPAAVAGGSRLMPFSRLASSL